MVRRAPLAATGRAALRVDPLRLLRQLRGAGGCATDGCDGGEVGALVDRGGPGRGSRLRTTNDGKSSDPDQNTKDQSDDIQLRPG